MQHIYFFIQGKRKIRWPLGNCAVILLFLFQLDFISFI